MSNHIVIKEEANNEHDVGIGDPQRSLLLPDPTPSSSSVVLENDPTLLSALLDVDDNDEVIDEDDEIIREIDVYISPELANTMYLIQYPLQQASHCQQIINTSATSSSSLSSSSRSKSQNQKNIKATATSPHPPLQPVSAKIKPQHAMLELEFQVPTSSFSNQRQIPIPLDLSHRKFSSKNIPMVTHMAMGILDSTSSKLDLVPLHRIMQMRPCFDHVDVVFQDDDDNDDNDDDNDHEEEEIAGKARKEDEEKKKTLQPIVFKKSESERAVIQRRSSYAYKKANEDAEEWIDIDVHDMKSLATKELMKKAYCPRSARQHHLKFLKAGKTGGNVGYVRSLNYLPKTVVEDTVEDFTFDDKGEVISDRNQEPEWKRELTSIVCSLLQERGGIPVPYPIIRSRFQPSIPDKALIEALSASAVLVRGNFVLKSSLMALSNIHIENARDVILILMKKYGFVQRMKLFTAFQSAHDEMSLVIKIDVINSLLDLMGRKTLNGIEMKIDDDVTFESKFNDVARAHELYWELKETQLQKYIKLYDEGEDNIDTNEVNSVLFGTKVH